MYGLLIKHYRLALVIIFFRIAEVAERAMHVQLMVRVLPTEGWELAQKDRFRCVSFLPDFSHRIVKLLHGMLHLILVPKHLAALSLESFIGFCD